VGFGEHAVGQAQECLGVGEDADHVGAALDLLVQPFYGFVDQIFFQWLTGKAANAVMSPAASRSVASTLGTGGPAWPRSCRAGHGRGRVWAVVALIAKHGGEVFTVAFGGGS